MQRASGVPHALFGRKIQQSLGRMASRGRKRVFGVEMSTLVMPGLDPGIHQSSQDHFRRRWIAGSSPAMTKRERLAAQRKNGLLRCARNDVQTHLHALAAQCARGFAVSSAQRGRGERRMPLAPAASRALCSGRTHTSNNEHPGITRRSRTQWFYGLFRALPGDRALLPPSPTDMSCLSPVGPT